MGVHKYTPGWPSRPGVYLIAVTGSRHETGSRSPTADPHLSSAGSHQVYVFRRFEPRRVCWSTERQAAQ